MDILLFEEFTAEESIAFASDGNEWLADDPLEAILGNVALILYREVKKAMGE